VIRFVFSKTGFTRYISHLDINRSMQRIFTRAGVPIWYTQGFNPHPYMTFSAALSVGVCGENEMMDIKLSEEMPFDEILERMNKASPDGIHFKKVYEATNDFSEIEKALYTFKVAHQDVDDFEVFLAKDEIQVTKKTKRGEALIDIKQETEIIGFDDDEGGRTYKIILPCGTEKNISATLLTTAFDSEIPALSKHEIIQISRIEFYGKDGKVFI